MKPRFIFSASCFLVILLSACEGTGVFADSEAAKTVEAETISASGEREAVSKTIFVAESGDDDADGETPETAFRTISQAVRAVHPGGTITVFPGTYSEEIIVEGLGAAEFPVTLRGAGPGVVLDGLEEKALGFWCEACSNVIIEGVEIRNYTDVGIGILDSSEVTFWDLNIHDNGFAVQLRDWELEGYGILVDQSSGILVEDNVVYRNGPQPQLPGNLMGTGINVFGCSDCVIRRNQSYENVGGGILVEDSFKVLVEENEIYANDLDAREEGWWDGGIWVDGGGEVSLLGNRVHDNLGPGIQISDEDIQHPRGYVLEGNVIRGNYIGVYVWNFGSNDLPGEEILLLRDNQIGDNLWQDLLVEDWTCPLEDQPCD